MSVTSHLEMAGPLNKRASELIDLTLDEDDDDVLAVSPSRTTTSTNGVANGHNNSHAIPISSNAHAPVSQYFQSGPPPKRVKLANTHYVPNAAQSVTYPYAQAGARHAVAQDPRLVEAVLREKVRYPSHCVVWGPSQQRPFYSSGLSFCANSKAGSHSS